MAALFGAICGVESVMCERKLPSRIKLSSRINVVHTCVHIDRHMNTPTDMQLDRRPKDRHSEYIGP